MIQAKFRDEVLDSGYRQTLTNPPRDLDALLHVTFCINLRDIGLRVTECDLRRFQSECLSNFSRRGMPQLIRKPLMRLPPFRGSRRITSDFARNRKCFQACYPDCLMVGARVVALAR